MLRIEVSGFGIPVHRGVAVAAQLHELRRDYYTAMHWNPETGHLQTQRARELGIDGLLAGYLDA